MLKKFQIFIFLFLCVVFTALSQNTDSIPQDRNPGAQWIDSVMNSLSLDQKIAQLLMIRTYSNKDESYYKKTEELISKYNVGGLCFFQGGPIRQAKLVNRYQAIAETPLLIAMDAEWGPGMRLDSTESFPFQMTLGTIEDDTLIYQMGASIAKQLHLLGVNINFAPVVDINNNPDNPVINSRSFGADKFMVAAKGIAYMKGLQDNGIIATAKHFPGHGDTGSDSHLTLPVINHDRSRLDSVELYPFRQMINKGLDAVMVAHLFIPALDDTPDTPTTLSKKVITDLLKDELGFKGLIITDALDMKGVTNYHQPGEIEAKAFEAGNDILLLPQDVGKAIDGIKEAIDKGQIKREEIDERCRKVLTYKFRAGLNHFEALKTDSLYEKLNNVEDKLIQRAVYKEAVTVLKNQDSLVPLRRFDTLNIASVSLGSAEITPFQEMLNNYTHVEKFSMLDKTTENQQKILMKNLDPYNLVILSIHNTSIFPTRNFNISDETLQLIGRIVEKKKVILTDFGSPYSLNLIDSLDRFQSIIIAHQDTRISNEITAQIIMGAFGASGTLPVTLKQGLDIGKGIKTDAINRLAYSIPEEMGIASADLNPIDSMVLAGIRDESFPGCQIVIALKGKIIYNKSFGYHTYKKGDFVKNTDLYDLASITKVAATTLSVMKLNDQNKLDIDFKLKWYLPYLNGTNKEDIIIRELMAHEARLQPWIPFYLNTMKDGEPDPALFSRKLDEHHTVRVAKNMFMDKNYQFVMYDSIAKSKLIKKKEYKYSDLGFYLMKQAIENITNKPLDQYVQDTFYKSLGLQYTCFNPLNRFGLNDIVPTEDDIYFRKQLIHGYVHDPGAAMMGGVSGHAGLFSNAGNLAVIMQMLLQNGKYGGSQYLQPATVHEFTKQQFPLEKNRRGIGFDKPDPKEWENGPACKSASANSFGHSGFTGTYTWADPDCGLVYVFLSNRVYPSAENLKLIKNNTRTRIMEVVYDAIQKSDEKSRTGKLSRIVPQEPNP